MHRGIERRTIFDGETECEHFLDLLGEVRERYRFVIHAYCLLDTHWHAIVQTPDANLSQGMQWLGLAYSSWYNGRHRRAGPLFQGRFKSVPVEQGAWVYELSLYVHLNPVRMLAFGLDKKRKKAESKGLMRPPTQAQVTARLKRLREHPWSSYRAYGGYERGRTWLHTDEILKRASRGSGDRKAHYRNDVQQILKRGLDESRLERFRDVVGIGSAQFIGRMKELAGEGGRETERRKRLRERVSFEQVVEAVEKVRGEERKDWLHQRGDWGKWLVLRLARQYCGLTLSALGDEMGGSDYAAVSMGLRRFEKRMGKDRKMRRVCEQAKRMLNV